MSFYNNCVGACSCQVQAAGTLLMIEFSTLCDYLFLLRGVAESLAPHGPTVMLYLAAAVSDFYIPPQDLVGHMQFMCCTISPEYLHNVLNAQPNTGYS